jgi:anti-sigma factor RsiW
VPERTGPDETLLGKLQIQLGVDTMDELKISTTSGAAPCGSAIETLLTLYVDGELASSEQPRLFTHLSTCPDCRRSLEAVMRFRCIVREEHLVVPPAADDAFFKRLARHKHVRDTAARPPERISIWRTRTPVSLRSAAALVVVVFLVGLLTPVHNSDPVAPVLRWVVAEEERVDLTNHDARYREQSAVYVFYPGLTIEANKSEETPVLTETL